VPGLQKVEQDMPDVFVGSIHRCTFENYQATISPLRMIRENEGMLFAESCEIPEMNLSLVYEYVCKKINEETCGFACRILNKGDTLITEEKKSMLFNDLKQMTEKLKAYCEKLEESFF
jgi:hypothetical protein